MNDQVGRLRKMRSKRPSAVQRKVAAVLDLGSAKISCVLLKFDQHLLRDNNSRRSKLQPRIQVLGSATLQSRGIRLGEIEDQRTVADLIRQVLTMAQSQAGTRVDHAFLCTSGGNPASNSLINAIAIGGSHVDSDDVARTISECRLPELAPDRALLSVQPINFSIDHRSHIADPIGMRGHRLSADLHAVDIDRATLDGIVSCVDACNLDVCGIVTSAHVSALAALVEDEQDLGAACVDIGAGVVSLSVYFRRQLICTRTVKIGGQHITADICRMFSVSEPEAERIKTIYGSLYFDQRTEEQKIMIERMGKGRHEISRASLFRVIRPRMEEILEEISLVLDDVEFEALPGQRIVLTGGCSNIQDLDELAIGILGPHVRFGRPVRLSGLPQEISGPQYSAVVGACLDSLAPQIDISDFPVSRATLGKRTLGRTLQWIADGW